MNRVMNFFKRSFRVGLISTVLFLIAIVILSCSWIIHSHSFVYDEHIDADACKYCGLQASAYPHEHVWALYRWIEPATCESNGICKQKCTICDAFQEEVRPALGHDFSGSCQCSRCNMVDDSKHVFTGCKCIYCGKVDESRHAFNGCKCFYCGKVDASRHAFSGCKCIYCGTIDESRHVFVNCTCTTCGKIQHDEGYYKWSNSSDRCYADYTCSVCGQIWEKTVHTKGPCRICGETYYEKSPVEISWYWEKNPYASDEIIFYYTVKNVSSKNIASIKTSFKAYDSLGNVIDCGIGGLYGKSYDARTTTTLKVGASGNYRGYEFFDATADKAALTSIIVIFSDGTETGNLLDDSLYYTYPIKK